MNNLNFIEPQVSSITLNNGVIIPQVGLGTFLIPKEKVVDTIGTAFSLGYRQYDTAWRYHNENEISLALKKFKIPREQVFVTTKVNADALYFSRYHGGPLKFLNIRIKSIRKAVEESFKNLGFDYIDLFLVHTPWPMYLQMYEVLSDFYYQGRIRAIGVSSFLPPMIASLKEVSDVIPAVNQFEISPLNTQKPLIKWCQDRGIAVEAMSTFSHFRSNEPRLEIIDNPDLKEIAETHGKTVVQVVLRWLLQQDIILIPKTWNLEHLKENIDIFDFTLSEVEVKRIDALDKGRFLNYNPYGLLVNVPKIYRNWNGFEISL